MKTKIIFTYIITVVLSYSSSAQNDKQDIKAAEWLIGSWLQKTSKGNIYETWTKLNDYELAGKSYYVNSQDTTVLEHIRLIQENDQLVYIPTVQNQNDGLPIRFVSRGTLGKQLVFENKAHDFPQVISYEKIAEDSLMASISGLIEGKIRKRVFRMRRYNKNGQ